MGIRMEDEFQSWSYKHKNWFFSRKGQMINYPSLFFNQNVILQISI